MLNFEEIKIPAKDVRSLSWQGDSLVDWVGGGRRFELDKSVNESRVNYAYRFDAAISSRCGRFAVIFERFGTKGLLLDSGKVIRELNRSFYHAHVYEYPVTFFTLPDGTESLAHCPDEYNRIEFDEVLTGKRLTTSQAGSSALDCRCIRDLAFGPKGA